MSSDKPHDPATCFICQQGLEHSLEWQAEQRGETPKVKRELTVDELCDKAVRKEQDDIIDCIRNSNPRSIAEVITLIESRKRYGF
jgi:hypothetical protein